MTESEKVKVLREAIDLLEDIKWSCANGAEKRLENRLTEIPEMVASLEALASTESIEGEEVCVHSEVHRDRNGILRCSKCLALITEFFPNGKPQERDYTPELRDSVATMLIFITKHGLLEKWKEQCAAADKSASDQQVIRPSENIISGTRLIDKGTSDQKGER